MTPNPAPQGEWITVVAAVSPAPGNYSAVEFVFADEAGNSWDSRSPVDSEGVSWARLQPPALGTYYVTAFYLGNSEFAPSTSSTLPYSVLERIVTVPGFSLAYSPVYADQTVPFTMWARPTPLTGDLRLNASTWVKSGDYPATAGDAHGTLNFDYGNFDQAGGYRVYAELRNSSAGAKGCPVTILPQLRPDDPQLTVSPVSAPAGTTLTFSASVFDPSELPGIYGFLSATLHFRHEDGHEVNSREIDVTGGSGSTLWSLQQPGTYDVWFSLTDYIWAVPESNHVTVTVLPYYDQPFQPLRATQPGAQPTTITLDPLPASGLKNDPIPFRVTISPAPDTGRVTIQDGSSSFALLSPTGTPGVYTAAGYRLPAGPHRLRAVYDGSAAFAPSASEPQEVFADSIPTTTTLTFSPDHPDALTDITVTATVSPVPPSGTVYVYRDGTLHLWGQVNTTTGQVTWTDTWPTWAIHHLTARFEYGATFADSHSDTVTLEVSTVTTAGVTLAGPTTVPNAGVKTLYSAEFAQTPSIYASLALYIDGVRTSVAVTENPQPLATKFTPGRHTVQVLGSPQPGVEGWSNVLTVDVGPYANRSLIQGTVVVNNGNPFTNSNVVVVEPSLATNSPYAASFQLSNDGIHWATFGYVEGYNNTVLWDLSDAACGGSDSPGDHRVYYRWTNYQGADGVPIESVTVTITDAQSSSFVIDREPPVVLIDDAVAGLRAASPAKVAAVDIDWDGHDDISGIAVYELELSVDGSDWQQFALANPTQSSAKLHLAEGTSYVFRVRARDRAGNLSGWTTSGTQIVPPNLDVTPPSISAPVVELMGGRVLTRKLVVRISWPDGTDATGVADYRLERSVNGGPWTVVTLPNVLATSVDLGLATGSTHTFRLRATDPLGNTSDYAPGATFRLDQTQEKASAISYLGTWKRVALSGSSGGYVKRSTGRGAKATYSFAGQWIAIASTLGPNRGIARVVVDGTAYTIDLYSATVKTGWLVFSTGITGATHSLVIEVTGSKNASSSGTRVDLDALIVLRKQPPTVANHGPGLILPPL